MVTSLSLGNSSTQDFTGIRAFTNLTGLRISNVDIIRLNLSQMQSLTTLSLSGGFACDSLILTNCSNLVSLFGDGDYDNEMYVNLMGVTNLRSVYFIACRLSDLDLRICDSLTYLTLDMTPVNGTINTSGLQNLQTIYFTRASSLIARECFSLREIKTEYGAATLFDVTGCTGLQRIEIFEMTCPSLDLSSCINFETLQFNGGGMDGFLYLNVKNGRHTTVGGCCFQQYNNLNICADDFEIADLMQAVSTNLPYANQISSTCTFFPGGNYNNIKGKARLDVNSNGCGINDPGMNQVGIRIDNGSDIITRFTSGNGDYRHYPYAGVFTLTPYFPYPYFNISPATATVDFDTANSLVDSVDFCITPSGVHNDVDITVLPLTPARPGFNATYQLAFKNRGTTIPSGTVQFNYDNTSSTFVSSSASTASQGAGQINWNYSNLQPFERRTINVTFNLFPPPNNNIGDTLYYLANISPVTGDETPYDNSFVLPQLVIGSFDPNDKTCLQGAALSPADINKPLDYMIRFQNLGTDTAFNVVVMDTLSDKLDLSTLEIISTSHPCDIELKNNQLQFYFRDINLPHAAINEPGSHGFVAFKIKTKSTVNIGDSLNNRAAIYFDFNLPVITNMASTVVLPLAPVPVQLEYFSASRREEGNLLTWKAPSTDGLTTFIIERSSDGINFSSIGNITATTERCRSPFLYTDENPVAGKNYYRLKITDSDGNSFFSKVLLVVNNKGGLEITAFIYNQQNGVLYLRSSKQETFQLKVIAGDGKMIYSQGKTIAAGTSIVNLPLKNTPTGVYTLVIYTTQGEIITRRFYK